MRTIHRPWQHFRAGRVIDVTPTAYGCYRYAKLRLATPCACKSWPGLCPMEAGCSSLRHRVS